MIFKDISEVNICVFLFYKKDIEVKVFVRNIISIFRVEIIRFNFILEDVKSIFRIIY